MDDNEADYSRLSWSTAAVVGGGAIGLSIGSFVGPVALLLAVAGLSALLVGLHLARRSPRIGESTVEMAAVAAIVAFSATAIPNIDGLYGSPWPGWLRLGTVAIALVGVLWAPLRIARRQVFVGVLLIWLVAVLSIMALSQNPDLGVDVQHAHTEAATVLLDGRNPYSDMVIRDGSPAEVNQGLIIGYSYPPVSLVLYTLGHMLGDARFTGVDAIVVVLLVVLTFAVRVYPGASVFVGVISTIPLPAGIIVNGWTEPVQAMFLLLSAATHRRWVLSSVLLGLAVASKQYMVLVLVPVAVSSDTLRFRRAGVAVGVASATYIPLLLWNPAALWYSLVGYQLQRIPRFDVMSVWSIGWRVPAAVAVLAAIGLCLILWRDLRTPGTLMLGQATILGVYFVLTPNSFVNLWFLVAILAVASVAFSGATRSEGEEASFLSNTTS